MSILHQNGYSSVLQWQSMDRERKEESGFSSMGRWLAVGSELPCSVIALLLAGQVIGRSMGGETFALWGALFGALIGFALGVYGVYATVRYFEDLDTAQESRPTYMPDMDEILEDVKFDLDEESDSSSQ